MDPLNQNPYQSDEPIYPQTNADNNSYGQSSSQPSGGFSQQTPYTPPQNPNTNPPYNSETIQPQQQPVQNADTQSQTSQNNAQAWNQNQYAQKNPYETSGGYSNNGQEQPENNTDSSQPTYPQTQNPLPQYNNIQNPQQSYYQPSPVVNPEPQPSAIETAQPIYQPSQNQNPTENNPYAQFQSPVPEVNPVQPQNKSTPMQQGQSSSDFGRYTMASSPPSTQTQAHPGATNSPHDESYYGTYAYPAQANPQSAAPDTQPPTQNQQTTQIETVTSTEKENRNGFFGKIHAIKDSIFKEKKHHLKPFIKALVVGVVIYGLLSSEFIIGQIQYLTNNGTNSNPQITPVATTQETVSPDPKNNHPQNQR